MHVDLAADRPRMTISLDDGSEVTLSPLRPEDRYLLVDGLEQLSPESRFTRFGQGLAHLTHAELEYLSNVDQRTHVAWGGSIDEDSAGVGRYICLEEDGIAEVAVTVIDDYQGLGLGTLLFQALAAVARHDGVRAFRFEVVPGNEPMERMTRGLDMELDEREGLVVGLFPIAEVPPHPNEAEMVSVIEAARAPAD
jgi:GNAT superfamily N-acetyltransferase